MPKKIVVLTDTHLGQNGKVTHLFYGHTHDADMWNVPSTQISAINLGSWLVEPGRETTDTHIFLITDDPAAGKVKMNPVVIG
jgi:UDP-2,3-diacylglucosamine pyrophosphatase LpxH